MLTWTKLITMSISLLLIITACQMSPIANTGKSVSTVPASSRSSADQNRYRLLLEKIRTKDNALFRRV